MFSLFIKANRTGLEYPVIFRDTPDGLFPLSRVRPGSLRAHEQRNQMFALPGTIAWTR